MQNYETTQAFIRSLEYLSQSACAMVMVRIQQRYRSGGDGNYSICVLLAAIGKQ